MMAMIITWQVLSALTCPKRNKDFSRAAFIVAPGLTVKERLQVLLPGHLENYYDLFSLCPNEALRQKLNQVELLIDNWHSLMPLKVQDRSVVKKGTESDEAYVRRVLGKAGSETKFPLKSEVVWEWRIDPAIPGGRAFYHVHFSLDGFVTGTARREDAPI